MNREINACVCHLLQNRGQARMAVKKEAVRCQPQVRIRPMPARQGDEFRQIGMDGGFTSKQGENVRTYTPAPRMHPAIRFRQRENAAVPVV